MARHFAPPRRGSPTSKLIRCVAHSGLRTGLCDPVVHVAREDSSVMLCGARTYHLAAAFGTSRPVTCKRCLAKPGAVARAVAGEGGDLPSHFQAPPVEAVPPPAAPEVSVALTVPEAKALRARLETTGLLEDPLVTAAYEKLLTALGVPSRESGGQPRTEVPL